MANLVLLDKAGEQNQHVVVLQMPPYNGEVSITVIPKTRALVMKAENNAKRNPKYNRHSVWDDEKGKKVSHAGDPDGCFIEELAKLLVVDWEGVTLADGTPAPCDDEHKVMLFNNVEVTNYLIKASSEIGIADVEADEKN